MNRCACDLLEYGLPTTLSAKSGSENPNLLTLPPVTHKGSSLELSPHFMRPDVSDSSFGSLLQRIQSQQEEILQSVSVVNQKIAEEQSGVRGVIQEFHTQVLAAISGLSVKNEKGNNESHAPEGNGTNARTSFLLDPTYSPRTGKHHAHMKKRRSGQKDKLQQIAAPGATDNFDWKALPHTWPIHNLKCSTVSSSKVTTTAASDNSKRIGFRRLCRRVARSKYLDFAMSFVIAVNLLTMFVQLQLREKHTEYKLGLRANDDGWERVEAAFRIMEYGYCSLFVVECTFRLLVVGLVYLKSKFNIFDLVVVLGTAFETFFLPVLGVNTDGANLSILRLAKIFRVVRLLKVIESHEAFHELRVLLRTLLKSAHSLLWSITLVSSIIVAGGILMVQLAGSFMHDDGNSMEDRLWVYDHFGSAAKSTWTIFEATFTTGWPVYAQRLIRRVNGGFAIFWVIWTICINFALMRVIAALFLKQTMKVAAEDDDRMAFEKVQEKGKFADQIRMIFEKGDTSGDGGISADEFMAMIYERDICEGFIKLDIELFEAVTLFRLLADEDGIADYDEFLQGAMKLKNSASTVDVIQILHEHAKLSKQVEQLAELVIERTPSHTSHGASHKNHPALRQ